MPLDCVDLPPPVLVPCRDFVVVRDDLLPGGTKMRGLPALCAAYPAHEYVYASPVYGYAQIALALTGQRLGKRVTIFCAARKTRHLRTQAAMKAGAHIVEVPHGYLSVVQARARAYASITRAQLLPFGLDVPIMVEALAGVARALPVVPTEIWCVAGSGTLCRALQYAWPHAVTHAVRIGAVPAVEKARLWQAPESFEHDARCRPPYPSCSNYDAKLWQFAVKHASPGALLWNVA